MNLVDKIKNVGRKAASYGALAGGLVAASSNSDGQVIINTFVTDMQGNAITEENPIRYLVGEYLLHVNLDISGLNAGEEVDYTYFSVNNPFSGGVNITGFRPTSKSDTFDNYFFDTSLPLRDISDNFIMDSTMQTQKLQTDYTLNNYNNGINPSDLTNGQGDLATYSFKVDDPRLIGRDLSFSISSSTIRDFYKDLEIGDIIQKDYTWTANNGSYVISSPEPSAGAIAVGIGALGGAYALRGRRRDKQQIRKIKDNR